MLVSSGIFIICYMFKQPLFNTLFVWIFLPIVISGTVVAILFIWSLIYKSKLGIICGLAALSTVGVKEVLDSELLKSEITLEAVLVDDLSSLRLILRKNRTFEMISSRIFSEKKFAGDYKREEDKIIFLDKAYGSSFIPDTVYIWHDKIILNHDEEGQADTSFANFFEIRNMSEGLPQHR